jgi:hypothetical protein
MLPIRFEFITKENYLKSTYEMFSSLSKVMIVLSFLREDLHVACPSQNIYTNRAWIPLKSQIQRCGADLEITDLYLPQSLW